MDNVVFTDYIMTKKIQTLKTHFFGQIGNLAYVGKQQSHSIYSCIKYNHYFGHSSSLAV